MTWPDLPALNGSLANCLCFPPKCVGIWSNCRRSSLPRQSRSAARWQDGKHRQQRGPRLSLAIGNAVLQFPFLRLGYGLYFGRVPNGRLISALTQTGPTKGELNFFMHPTDNLNAGGAPPFPNALAGEPLTWSSQERWSTRPDFAIQKFAMR